MLGPMDHGLMPPQTHRQEDVQRRLTAMRLQERLGVPADEKREGKLREASQDFEAIFLHQMLKQMRATVPKEGLLHSKDEEFWQSHFDAEMSVQLARSGGIGLGEMIFEQLREHQVKASEASTPPASGPLPAMTLLAPRIPDVTEREENADPAPDAEAVGSASGPAFRGLEKGQGLDSESEEEQSGPSLGAPGVMGMVRSLANAIEERGGVVPEHPGATVQENEPMREMTSAVGVPPMHWPLQSRVSSGFGWRPDPFTGERAWHAGIDIAAPAGAPVQAAWDGQVVFAGERGGYGRMVIVEHHDGWRTLYAHNNENKVQAGDTVRAGQTIATVGSSGRATGPHLHFEIRQDNLAWNPKQIRDRLLAGLPIGRGEPA